MTTFKQYKKSGLDEGFKTSIDKNQKLRLKAIEKAKRAVKRGMSPEKAVKEFDLYPADLAKLKNEDKSGLDEGFKDKVKSFVSKFTKKSQDTAGPIKSKTPKLDAVDAQTRHARKMREPTKERPYGREADWEQVAWLIDMKKKSQKKNEDLEENLGPTPENSRSIHNSEMLRKVNNELRQISGEYITPYIAMHRSRKVLAQHNIFMVDQLVRLPDDLGEYYFQVYQYGTQKTYKTNSGEWLDQNDIGPELYIYINVYGGTAAGGFYTVEMRLVSGDELETIIGDDEIEEF